MRWIQDPETGKLIPRDEYVPPSSKQHLIMRDIKPFVSPIDGEVITTRPQLARHNREHGVTNSADYSPEYLKNVRDSREKEQYREGREARIETLKHLIR